MSLQCTCSEFHSCTSSLSSTVAASDVCESSVHYPCIYSSVDRSSSDSNSACTSSCCSCKHIHLTNCSIDPPNCDPDLPNTSIDLPNCDPDSPHSSIDPPNCSLVSQVTVQSENILENAPEEIKSFEYKISQIESKDNKVQEVFHNEEDTKQPEIGIKVKVINEGELDEKSKNVQSSCHEISEDLNSLENNESKNIVIDAPDVNNNPESVKEMVTAKLDNDTEGDTVKNLLSKEKNVKENSNDIVDADGNLAEEEEIEKIDSQVNEVSFRFEDKVNTGTYGNNFIDTDSNDVNNECARVANDANTNFNDDVEANTNSKPVSEEDMANSDVDNIVETPDEVEKPLEFVVKSIKTGIGSDDSYTTGIATERLTLIPKDLTPKSAVMAEKGAEVKQSDKCPGRKRGRKPSLEKKVKQVIKRKQEMPDRDKEVIIVPRPMPSKLYPLGVLSKILDTNHRPEPDKRKKPSEIGPRSVTISEGAQNFKNVSRYTEKFETDLNNIKINRKIIRLSSTPVKMYKIVGSYKRNIVDTSTDNEADYFPEKIDNAKKAELFRKENLSSKVTSLTSEIDKFKSKQEISRPIFQSTPHMPLTDKEIGQVNYEEFFSTELFTPIYSSNPFCCGDGLKNDFDLEKIEKDIFELQDEYFTPASNVTAMQDDQTLLSATALENVMNPAVVSGLNPNIQSQILNEGLNPSQGCASNAIPTGYQQTVSVDGGNLLTSVSSVPISGNLLPNSTHVMSDGLSQGNVNFSTNVIQGHVNPELLPTTVQVSSTNLLQGNAVSPIQLQTNSEQRTGNLPNIPTLQGTITQAPVQVPNAVLQALKQSGGGVAINPSSQNALLQQLSCIISNQTSSVQSGTKVVAMDIKSVNPLNTLQQGIQSIPQGIQSVTPEIQSVPQGIQSTNLIGSPSTLQGQIVSVSGSLATGNIGLTNARLVTEDNRLCSDLMTSNLSSVNQSNLQSSSYVTQTDSRNDGYQSECKPVTEDQS